MKAQGLVVVYLYFLSDYTTIWTLHLIKKSVVTERE